VQAEEMLLLPGNLLAIAFNLDKGEVGVILLDHCEEVEAGAEVRRTGKVMEVPVGEALLGRVVGPAGRPLDGRGAIMGEERLQIEREAPPIMARAPVEVPLQTGIKVVDALVPIGRGQRELILGDRQTGKTAIAVDTIINQKETGVLCIYCAIGQRSSALARVIKDLEEAGAMEYTTVVATSGEDPAGRQFIAPYAATAMGEHFMEQGRDVLIIYDDLTRHAWAYRELSLLLRRPPGREAFPGDVFYIHSRLLERATHLKKERGGGSLTALPIAETQAQNLSAYIPTNLISITDGQIYLSPVLQQRGVMPAVDVGRSVSRVGGKAQLPAYRAVTGDLRLSYSQFEELERFSRYGARLDDERQRVLAHGRRVREVLQQPQYEPMAVVDQIAVLHAVTRGLFDRVPPGMMAEAEARLHAALREWPGGVRDAIEKGEELDEEKRGHLERLAAEAVESVVPPRVIHGDG
jgi:F-type H+-transporting ATPase subunit alpha